MVVVTDSNAYVAGGVWDKSSIVARICNDESRVPPNASNRMVF